MDIGIIIFDCVINEIDEWKEGGRALISFPTYYSPNFGDNIQCELILDN